MTPLDYSGLVRTIPGGREFRSFYLQRSDFTTGYSRRSAYPRLDPHLQHRIF
jgi:hypothetical protein